MVLYNALETISMFSFAQQMMFREFGVLKGRSPLKIMGGERGEGALNKVSNDDIN
ncbi:MAG: hypothetical protein XD96_0891 [Petrotoga mobilis]|nr:MAG: hypothetical protein XD96_0891 [Petrotoga mobilis]